MREHTKLHEYLARKSLSHRAFARAAGIPHLHPMVGLWCKGEHLPGLETAFAIERGTEGEIPVSYWLGLKAEAKAEAKAARAAPRRQAARRVVRRRGRRSPQHASKPSQ